eukprot:jgi/Chlat1/2649/Chrsp178S02489
MSAPLLLKRLAGGGRRTAARARTAIARRRRQQLPRGSERMQAPDWLAGAPPSIGLDIGGTLCKMVYFEPDSSPTSNNAVNGAQALSNGRKTLARLRIQVSTTLADSTLDQQAACQSAQSPMQSAESPCTTPDALWSQSHQPIVLEGRGVLHFQHFETWKMDEFLPIAKEHAGFAFGATGGGARKYEERFSEQARIHLARTDELTCLIRGIDMLAWHAVGDCFTFPTGSYTAGAVQKPLQSTTSSSSNAEDTTDAFAAQNVNLEFPDQVLIPVDMHTGRHGAPYPYLVVNIGSGVSILLVTGPGSFSRVGGSSIGGSTFLGLAHALTGCASFSEALALAARGDSTAVDMLVGDIYGGDYDQFGLAATIVASSFGKLVRPEARKDSGSVKALSLETLSLHGPRSPGPNVILTCLFACIIANKAEDLAKSALLMVTNNAGSLAMLHARAAGARRILFAGSFLRHNILAMRLLAVAVEFWSKGDVQFSCAISATLVQLEHCLAH